MKKLTLLSPLMAVLLSGCGGSGSSNTEATDVQVKEDNTTITAADDGARFDNDTELQTGFQELRFEDVYIVDGNDVKITGTTVALNTRFSIVYEGVKNYILKNGKAFPGIALQVTDADQNMIVNEIDLFGSYVDGMSEDDAATLRATIAVGDPMKPGKYICSIHVSDKNNSEATILSTWSFEVK